MCALPPLSHDLVHMQLKTDRRSQFLLGCVLFALKQYSVLPCSRYYSILCLLQYLLLLSHLAKNVRDILEHLLRGLNLIVNQCLSLLMTVYNALGYFGLFDGRHPS